MGIRKEEIQHKREAQGICRKVLKGDPRIVAVHQAQRTASSDWSIVEVSGEGFSKKRKLIDYFII